MSAIVVFLVAVILPLFFGSPRTVHMWLAVQGFALAWYAVARHGFHSAYTVTVALELLVIRGALAPWLLAGLASGTSAGTDESATPARGGVVDHLLPSNLFAWILGISLSVLAFEFAASAAHGEAPLALGAACVSATLALFLLACNEDGRAQIFGLLLLENSAVLFESTLPEPWSPWVHGALVCIYLLTVWVAVSLLQGHDEAPGQEMTSGVP